MKRTICVIFLTVCTVMTLSGCGAAENQNLSIDNHTSSASSAVSAGPSPASGEAKLGGSSLVDTEQAKDAAAGFENASEAETSPVTGLTAAVPRNNSAQAGSGAPQESLAVREISQITTLESGFSSVNFSGDDGFEAFLNQGGAASDRDVMQFLAVELLADATINSRSFGCSTLAVGSPDGRQLFGRNFDWQKCEALVVTSKPAAGYASISTVNLGFITQAGGSLSGSLTQNDVRVLAALYAPLDGMNEKGLAVSVNMIQDHASINQATGKPSLTTTTAVRLLLNKAANVEEALALLQQYDLHGSMGMMIHFALADTTGRSAVVEYIDNQMVVTDTPVVTNFYLAAGVKQGIGSQQSHTRFDILTQALVEKTVMTVEDVRDAMDSVSKDNFNEFESTEWSVVFDLSSGEAHYYHRENYENCFTFSIK